MTEPSAPTPEALDPQGRPLRSRSPIGRRIITSLAVALTGLVIWNGAGTIQRDTLGDPGPSTDRRCSEGIRRLHSGFNEVWEARRTGEDRALPPTLDRELRALGPVCEREGATGTEAYEHLLRWRYRAETQARLWSEALTDDARGALSYQSPESPER